MAAMSSLRLDGGTDFFTYLTTRTGAEMVQLVQGMEDPKAQAALTAALLFAPSPVSGRATLPAKAKKALNAFVGFRCYYLNIPPFKEWPMKKLSQPLGTLWDCDPNKSKWSLMAKAWSIMRDQLGKDNVPLEEFFRHACPYLKIPPPQVYLQQLGWVLGIDQHGAPVVEQGPSFTSQLPAVGVTDEAHSVEDIIRHVQELGYATSFVMNSNSTSATFLGHSNALKSRTTITKQTALSSQAATRRTADRNNRQARRQVALEVGFAAQLLDPIGNSQATEGMQGTTDNGENHHIEQQPAGQIHNTEFNFSIGSDVYQIVQQAPSGTDRQYTSADEILYNDMRAVATNSMTEPDTHTMQQLNEMSFDDFVVDPNMPVATTSPSWYALACEQVQAGHAAFREGADTTTTLPGMDGFP